MECPYLVFQVGSTDLKYSFGLPRAFVTLGSKSSLKSETSVWFWINQNITIESSFKLKFNSNLNLYTFLGN